MAQWIQFADNLRLPLDTAVVNRFGYTGTPGSGKSNSAQVVFEQFVLSGVQAVVIDVAGIWRGCAFSKDGKHRSKLKLIVIGGKSGATPIDVDKGEAYARWIVESGASVIFDLKGVREGARERFVEKFMRELYFIKGQADQKTPMHIFFEEAQRWVPQKPETKEERSVGALMREIAEQIRNDGVGLSFITPAPQSVDKRVFNLTQMLVVHQVGGPHERRAVIDWAVSKRLQLEDTDLTDLDVGEAWVWSPRWLKTVKKVKVRLKSTMNLSKTLKFGESQRATIAVVPEKALAALKSALKNVGVDTDSKDPVALRTRITELEKELEMAKKRKVVREIVEIEKPIFTKKQMKMLERILHRTDEAADAIHSAMEIVKNQSGDLLKIRDTINRALSAPSHTQPTPAPTPSPTPAPTQKFRSAPPVVHEAADDRSTTSSSAAPSGLKEGEREMVRFLCLSPNGLTRAELGALAGISIASGTVSNYVSRLKRAGFIDERDHRLFVTDAGLALYGSNAGRFPTAEELVDRHGLKQGERAMLWLIYKQGPKTRKELGEGVGVSIESGTVSNYVSRLKRAGLIDEGNHQLYLSSAWERCHR